MNKLILIHIKKIKLLNFKIIKKNYNKQIKNY